MQREKGATYEREVVKAFRDAGLRAERNLTQSRDGGHDLDTDIGRIECKRRRKLAVYLRPVEGVTGVVCRGDHEESLVVIRLSYLLQLVRPKPRRVRAPDAVLTPEGEKLRPRAPYRRM